MSNSNFMPLNGALLISNPRKSKMASAKNNPVRGVSNKIARAIYHQMRAQGAKSNPKHRFEGHAGAQSLVRADHKAITAAAKAGVALWAREKSLPKSERSAMFQRRPPKRDIDYDALPEGDPALLAAIHSAVRSQMKYVYGKDGKPSRGFMTRQYAAKGRRYNYKAKKAVRVPAKGIIPEHWGRAVPKPIKGESKAAYKARYAATDLAKLHDKRTKLREAMAGFDAATHTWNPDYVGPEGLGYWHEPSNPGASGAILMSLEGFKGGPGKRAKRRAKRRAPSKKVLKSIPTLGEIKASPKWKALSRSEKASFNNAYKAARAHQGGSASKEDIKLAIAEAMAYLPDNVTLPNPRYPKAHYRKRHGLAHRNGLALDNYGALALDNYGALALDNPLPFAGGVAADAGKLVLVGLAGALGHAFVADKVEEYLPKIPMGDKLLDLTVPEAVPLIGGMELDNTVSGFLAGGALIGLGIFLAQKGQRKAGEYVGILGSGIALAGPILDFAGGGSASSDDMDESVVADVNGLALSGLALENQGVFGDAYGDGGAYQLGAIVQDDDYGQASLGDAYYSGADFDLGEGQALVNGRSFFQKRYGHPARRVQSMGGKKGSASHLASQPGHRWGWLVKMIGWQNVQKLAAMPPKRRVSVIKQLREQAMASFKQMQVQADEQVLAAPELAPQGADGVSGVFGAYGATMFGGAGL
jgi:hypothetical protein